MAAPKARTVAEENITSGGAAYRRGLVQTHLTAVAVSDLGTPLWVVISCRF
jgi:hypothetical protein